MSAAYIILTGVPISSRLRFLLIQTVGVHCCSRLSLRCFSACGLHRESSCGSHISSAAPLVLLCAHSCFLRKLATALAPNIVPHTCFEVCSSAPNNQMMTSKTTAYDRFRRYLFGATDDDDNN